LFKQLSLLYGNGLGVEERKNNTSLIYQNILEGMKALVEGNEDLYGSDEKSPPGVKSVTQLCDTKIMNFINNLTTDEKVTETIAKHFKAAWADPGIKQTWENRSKLQIQDSVLYFMENIDRIAAKDYVPDKDDVLHIRNRTTGIIKKKLTMKNREFLIVDVGGQRSERRKWEHCFDDITALIYVASLASYNQLLFEDETTNRMEESLKVFERTISSKAFKDCSIILFLNKSDLFAEKVGKWPITSFFHNYPGPLTKEAQYEHIKRAFEAKNKSNRKIHVHCTCATDTSHIAEIFHVVNEKIINQALVRAGLIAPASP